MDQSVQINNKLENEIDCTKREVQELDKRVTSVEVILPRLEMSLVEFNKNNKEFGSAVNDLRFVLKDMQNEMKTNGERTTKVEKDLEEIVSNYKVSEETMKTDWRTALPGVIKFAFGIIVTCGTIIYVAIQFMQTYIASVHP